MADLTQFYAAHPLWVWAGLAAGLLALEVATGSGWLLWPAASAGIVAALAAFAGLPLAGALVVFALLTIITTLLGRRLLPTSLTHRGLDINDPHERLLGRDALTVAAFTNGAGRVFIDGKEWAAELDGEVVPPAGAKVEVVSVAGARLKVRAS
jgi:hypothetical protein